MHTNLSPMIAREQAADRRRHALDRRKFGEHRPPPKLRPVSRRFSLRPLGHRKAIR